MRTNRKEDTAMPEGGAGRAKSKSPQLSEAKLPKVVRAEGKIDPQQFLEGEKVRSTLPISETAKELLELYKTATRRSQGEVLGEALALFLAKRGYSLTGLPEVESLPSFKDNQNTKDKTQLGAFLYEKVDRYARTCANHERVPLIEVIDAAVTEFLKPSEVKQLLDTKLAALTS
jgi:hypothetical protein